MAVVLLLLSVIFHRALASDLANNEAYIWATRVVAIALSFAIAFVAPSVRIALGRLCLLNGGVTALMLCVLLAIGSEGAISADLSGSGDAPRLPLAGSPAIGSAILSAALGMIAVAFLVGSYFLLHVRDGRKNRATQS
jgi:hypothetical protein